jgi:acetyltransferase-like isoleucine patch superfamily enzyme
MNASSELWNAFCERKLFSGVGSEGFRVPATDNFQWSLIGDDRSADNWLLTSTTSTESGRAKLMQIELRGKASSNIVVLGDESQAAGKVTILGDRNIFVSAGANPYHFNLTAYVCGNDGAMFFGSGCTSNGVTAWTHGDKTIIAFGEDCMLSHGVIVRTSDDHSIIDLSTGHQLNQPESVVVEPHVWLCPEVHVLKGSRIGFGSIIGERSLVTSKIGRCVLAAGIPARAIPENVSWDRPLYPRPEIHRFYSQQLKRFNEFPELRCRP